LIYSAPNDDEWDLLSRWFDDSEHKYHGTVEAGIPAMSLLIGLITGNGIHHIVQCGHYIGYSSLMSGFYLRKMGKKHSLYSIDIDEKVTSYSQKWIEEAGLNDYVRLTVNDSVSVSEPDLAIAYLGGAPQLVFIDSSHQYKHTLDELDLWYPHVVPGGLIALHDTSVFAKTFDRSNCGGVGKAVEE
jgi:predicted O-methyltransferase YrrM